MFIDSSRPGDEVSMPSLAHRPPRPGPLTQARVARETNSDEDLMVQGPEALVPYLAPGGVQ
eukprot:5938059-Prorocentrum_lima.AAC.1